jgi:hypothetical protein
MAEKTKKDMAKEKKGVKKKTEKKSIAKKEKVEKEKVCEVFDVEKNGKIEEIKSCGVEEEAKPSEVQMKREIKIFKTVIIVMMAFVLFFLGVLWLINYFNHFSVGGVIFEIDKTDMVGKTLYKTTLPVHYQDSVTGKVVSAEYRFYFRNDPRTLDKIPMEGNITVMPNMVVNMTRDFNCNGDGMIAVANLLNLYKVIGVDVIKDDKATCDKNGQYTFLRITDGKDENYTGIIEYGLSGGCYNLYVNNCEILPVTEKFMLETLMQVNKQLNE